MRVEGEEHLLYNFRDILDEILNEKKEINIKISDFQDIYLQFAK